MRRSRRALGALSAAVLLISPGIGVSTANAKPHDHPVERSWSSGSKAHPGPGSPTGPIGWDTFRYLDQIPAMTMGVSSRQFSSFDRSGGNWKDGFDGTYSCMRHDADGCVIAEDAGPGEITSMWFTRDWGDVSKTGNIKITLDGNSVLDANVQDVIDGKMGGPFQPPFVHNADTTSGGVSIKVPMTYRESMRVTTTNNPLFYHVSINEFADASEISTFDPSYVPQDIFAASRTWGHADPKNLSDANKSTRLTTQLSIPAGGHQRLSILRKGGVLNELRFRVPAIKAPTPTAVITDDGRAFTGSSQFRVKIDPKNNGVKLTRRLDSGVAGQLGTVTVNGQSAAAWPQITASGGQWLDVSVTLPSTLTKGKDSILVRTDFKTSGLDFNEFRYFVDSLTPDGSTRTDEVDVGNQASEKAHSYAIEHQTWSGTRTYSYPSPKDPEVLQGNKLLRDLRVRVVADGVETVNVPFGEFFGSGLSRAEVRSLFYAVDLEGDGWFSSWWPMPYKKSLAIELVNDSNIAVTSGEAQVTYARDGRLGGHLSGANPTIGYFKAQSRRDETNHGSDWKILNETGFGKVVGVSQTVRGRMTVGNTREYLEGDERVHTDGSLSPAWHGTGTEDFYEGGWYFREKVPFSTPFTGATAIQFGEHGCVNKCDSMVRTLVADAIPFSNQMEFGIEHGGTNSARAEYATTAFWYGHTDRVKSRITDVVDVGDQRSESAHDYAGSGSIQMLQSSFEGDHDGVVVRDDLRSTKQPLTFSVKVDKKNSLVVLRRLSDQQQGYQQARVEVNGTDAGLWLEPLANGSKRWLEDTFMIPPSLTRGKSSLNIRLVPVGDVAWTSAQYEIISHGAAHADRQAPSPAAHLAADDSGNSIMLTWKPARDDVGIDEYAVFGSTDPDFTPTKATLLGTTALPGYHHNNPGLGETWYYLVRARDTSGNTSDFSSPVSVTSSTTRAIEFESLLPPEHSTMLIEPQSNCCGVSWSGGTQAWLKGQSGDMADFSLRVPKDGSYSIALTYTQAPDYGRFRILLDGQAISSTVDGFRRDGVGTRQIDLGSRMLTQGTHLLRVEVTGKNTASRGTFVGLDKLTLTLD